MAIYVQSVSQVDKAFYDLFNGQTVLNRAGQVEQINVQIEPPSTHIQENKDMPAISIRLVDEVFDGDRLNPLNSDIVVSQNLLTSPVELTTMKEPIPMRVYYQIDSYSADDAVVDRNMTALIRQKLPPRGSITVAGIDCWVFRDSFVTGDSAHIIERKTSGRSKGSAQQWIYHKIFQYNVLIDTIDPNFVVQKAMEEIRLTFNESVPSTSQSTQSSGLTIQIIE